MECVEGGGVRGEGRSFCCGSKMQVEGCLFFLFYFSSVVETRRVLNEGLCQWEGGVFYLMCDIQKQDAPVELGGTIKLWMLGREAGFGYLDF